MSTCKECAYFKPPATGTKGNCLVFPPLENGFPAVEAAAWCGQFVQLQPAESPKGTQFSTYKSHAGLAAKTYALIEKPDGSWKVNDWRGQLVGEAPGIGDAERLADEHAKNEQ